MPPSSDAIRLIFSCHLGSSLALGPGQLLNYYHHQRNPELSHFSTDCFLCKLTVTFPRWKLLLPSLFIFPTVAPWQGKWWMPRPVSGTQVPDMGAFHGPTSGTGRGAYQGLKDTLSWPLLFPCASRAVTKGVFWERPRVARLWKFSGGRSEWRIPAMALVPHLQGDFLVEGQLPRFILTLGQPCDFCLPAPKCRGRFCDGHSYFLPLFVCNLIVVKYTSNLPSEPDWNVQFSGSKYIHIVGIPSPPSIHRTFPSCTIEPLPIKQ